MTFSPYPEYKDSGVEWLGEVPEHWGVVPLRGTAKQEAYSFTDGDWVETPFITDEGVRLIQTGNIGVGKYREQGFRYISEETFSKLNCTEFFPDDVLICRLADPVGRACLAPDLGARMITSVDVCILKTKSEISSNFLVYFLSSDPYLSFMASVSRGGTRERVSRSFLGSVRILMPSVEEQSTIAAFLDHETARIDALVEEQQRLIKLLKEKRQAVISHAVTKGLDPDVPKRDSGVEWLGEVPAHWDTPRLKHVADAQGGSTPSKEREDYWLGDIPWVSPKDMKRDIITKTIDNVSEEAVGDSGLKIIPCRSVLVVVRGMILAHTFPVALSGVDVTINQDMKAIIPACERLLPEYLILLLRGIDEVIFDCIDSSAHGTKKLQWEEFFNTQVPLPSLDEQLRISSEVQAELDQLEQLTSQAQLMARTLSERRSALISAAVTGKIDVRGWQPPGGSSASSEATQTEMV